MQELFVQLGPQVPGEEIPEFVLAEVARPTTIEITQLRPLLDRLDLAVGRPTRSTPSASTPTGWSSPSTPPTS
jgi:hypothetical protein